MIWSVIEKEIGPKIDSFKLPFYLRQKINIRWREIIVQGDIMMIKGDSTVNVRIPDFLLFGILNRKTCLFYLRQDGIN
jgi:hypothetical protein